MFPSPENIPGSKIIESPLDAKDVAKFIVLHAWAIVFPHPETSSPLLETNISPSASNFA